MQILSTWKSGLEIFLPKNFKQFLLLTVNTFVRTMTTPGFWIFSGLIMFAVFFLCSILILFLNFLTDLLPLLAFCYILYVLFFNFLLVSRPSVCIKNKTYFQKYIGHFFIYSLFALLAFTPFVIGLSGFFLFYITIRDFFIYVLFSNLEYTMIVSSLVFLFMTIPFHCLFFLENEQPSISALARSLKQSVLFVVYNFPACIINALLILGLFWVVSFFIDYFIIALCVMLVLSYLATFYTRMVYQQKSLYFS